MNPKIVGHTPPPDPLPIGSADAERGKRSLRLDDGLRRAVQRFKSRISMRRNLTPSFSPIEAEREWRASSIAGAIRAARVGLLI
jgi:hypothetical protein